MTFLRSLLLILIARPIALFMTGADVVNRERLPPATTLDGSLALRLGPRLQLIARGENVLDATVIAGRAGNGVEERATPRTLWLGLRFRDGPA